MRPDEMDKEATRRRFVSTNQQDRRFTSHEIRESKVRNSLTVKKEPSPLTEQTVIS